MSSTQKNIIVLVIVLAMGGLFVWYYQSDDNRAKNILIDTVNAYSLMGNSEFQAKQFESKVSVTLDPLPEEFFAMVSSLFPIEESRREKGSVTFKLDISGVANLPEREENRIWTPADSEGVVSLTTDLLSKKFSLAFRIKDNMAFLRWEELPDFHEEHASFLSSMKEGEWFMIDLSDLPPFSQDYGVSPTTLSHDSTNYLMETMLKPAIRTIIQKDIIKPRVSFWSSLFGDAYTLTYTVDMNVLGRTLSDDIMSPIQAIATFVSTMGVDTDDMPTQEEMEMVDLILRALGNYLKENVSLRGRMVVDKNTHSVEKHKSGVRVLINPKAAAAAIKASLRSISDKSAEMLEFLGLLNMAPDINITIIGENTDWLRKERVSVSQPSTYTPVVEPTYRHESKTEGIVPYDAFAEIDPTYR